MCVQRFFIHVLLFDHCTVPYVGFCLFNFTFCLDVKIKPNITHPPPEPSCRRVENAFFRRLFLDSIKFYFEFVFGSLHTV